MVSEGGGENHLGPSEKADDCDCLAFLPDLDWLFVDGLAPEQGGFSTLPSFGILLWVLYVIT